LANKRNRSAPANRKPAPGQPPAKKPVPQTQAPKQRRAARQAPAAAASAARTDETGPPMTLALRVCWAALLAMVVLVPLSTSNLTVFGFASSLTADQFELIKVSVERVLTLVALAGWGWELLRRGGRIRHSPIDWLILAFLVWVAVTTATSLHWPTALLGRPRRYEGLVTFINYALIYFLILQFADRAARVWRLAQALFWSSVVVSAFGLLQFLGLRLRGWEPVGFEARRAFSTFGNPDFLGGFLIFSVTIALGLALLERRPWLRFVYWVGFGLNGVVLLATFTRGAWIGAFVALVLTAIVAWRQRVTLRRLDWIPAGVSLAAAAGIAYRSLTSNSQVLNFGHRLASIVQFGSGSGQTRTLIWKTAADAIKERPVLGSGADTFRLLFHRLKPAEYVLLKGGSIGADNAHNYVLELAAGIGIPGVLLFYGIFGWAAVRSFGHVFRRSGDATRLILGVFWAAAAGYLLYLLTGISVTGATLFLWIALAVVSVPAARVVSVRRLRGGAIAAVALLLLAAAGVVFQGVVVAADHAYAQALSSPSVSARVTGAQQALDLNRLNPEYRLGLGIAYLTKMQSQIDAAGQAQKGGQDSSALKQAANESFAKAEAALKDSLAFNPNEIDNYTALATLYNLAGQAFGQEWHMPAIETAQQGITLMPLATPIQVQLARALAATGRVPEAIQILEYCVKIDPSGAEAALDLAGFYEQAGEKRKALDVLRGVELRVPGQPGITDAIKRLQSELGSSNPTP
jgi:O-antigen ligase/tetratricopeptide (TPR) repeat protein